MVCTRWKKLLLQLGKELIHIFFLLIILLINWMYIECIAQSHLNMTWYFLMKGFCVYVSETFIVNEHVCSKCIVPGYQREVDSLLTVNRQTVLSDWENLEKSRNLLHIVLEETGLFPRGLGTHERYLFVMVNLWIMNNRHDPIASLSSFFLDSFWLKSNFSH